MYADGGPHAFEAFGGTGFLPYRAPAEIIAAL